MWPKNFQKPNTFPKSVQSLDTISLDPQIGYENVQIVFKHLTLLISQFGQVSKFQTHLGHIFGQVSKFWTHLGHILVKCPNSRHFFGHILDTCPNSENCLVTFWSSVQILDTFWSYFGHLPQVWTHFGLILDTFCPKCVYTHIVQEHRLFEDFLRAMSRLLKMINGHLRVEMYNNCEALIHYGRSPSQ